MEQGCAQNDRDEYLSRFAAGVYADVHRSRSIRLERATRGLSGPVPAGRSASVIELCSGACERVNDSCCLAANFDDCCQLKYQQGPRGLCWSSSFCKPTVIKNFQVDDNDKFQEIKDN